MTMAKSNLYTRTGDSGTTSLVGGARIRKDSLRLESYGAVDEFSSFLGVVASSPECTSEVRSHLLEVQNVLFNIGAYLASEVKPGETTSVWGLDPEDTAALERWTDDLDGATPKINAFVLPGGSPIAAHTHVARTVCRRAERHICALAAVEYVDPALMAYINRLSDYLFILARYFNHLLGVKEIVWRQKEK